MKSSWEPLAVQAEKQHPQKGREHSHDFCLVRLGKALGPACHLLCIWGRKLLGDMDRWCAELSHGLSEVLKPKEFHFLFFQWGSFATGIIGNNFLNYNLPDLMFGVLQWSGPLKWARQKNNLSWAAPSPRHSPAWSFLYMHLSAPQLPGNTFKTVSVSLSTFQSS